tara:strand:+ start:96 stop:344 length:249 start_codon:yes stop_codon:yes gene_type:complete
MDRTPQDLKNWHKGISNKEYFEYHPSDKNQFRTVYVKDNFFTGKPQMFRTNYVTGTPPENIPHIHPLMAARLNTLQVGGNLY